MLDELAIKYQKEYDTHREQGIATEEKHQAEVKGLQDEIATLEVGGLLFLSFFSVPCDVYLFTGKEFTESVCVCVGSCMCLCAYRCVCACL